MEGHARWLAPHQAGATFPQIAWRGTSPWQEVDLTSLWEEIPYFTVFSVEGDGDHFDALLKDDCCRAEVPEAVNWKRASSPDGKTWTVLDTTHKVPSTRVVLETETACVAFGYFFALLSGPDCNSLTEVPGSDMLFTDAALFGEGRQLVATRSGLLMSDDGLEWRNASLPY